MARKLSKNLYLHYNEEKECFELMENVNVFEIFITDLKEDVQKELIEFFGGDNGNYDVIPLMTFYNEDNENDE